MQICLKKKEPRCVKEWAAGDEEEAREIKICPKKKELKWKSEEGK